MIRGYSLLFSFYLPPPTKKTYRAIHVKISCIFADNFFLKNIAGKKMLYFCAHIYELAASQDSAVIHRQKIQNEKNANYAKMIDNNYLEK